MGWDQCAAVVTYIPAAENAEEGKVNDEKGFQEMSSRVPCKYSITVSPYLRSNCDRRCLFTT